MVQQQRVAKMRAQYELLDGQADDLASALGGWETAKKLQDEALVVLQLLEETWRGQYEDAISQLGSQGINSVFTEEYEVLLESSIKRGVASLDIVLVKNGKRQRIRGGSGGSVVQVLAYLLRYFLTTSQTPPWSPAGQTAHNPVARLRRQTSRPLPARHTRRYRQSA